MRFSEKQIKDFQSLEDLENEIFTPEECDDIRYRAEIRSAARRALSESISRSVAEYMAAEGIGFNELTRRLGISTATTSKILRGDANLTLDTIAMISLVIQRNPRIVFDSIDD